jgi:hypothetical protein
MQAAIMSGEKRNLHENEVTTAVGRILEDGRKNFEGIQGSTPSLSLKENQLVSDCTHNILKRKLLASPPAQQWPMLKRRKPVRARIITVTLI